MSGYNFDKIINRRGTGASKWNNPPYENLPADFIPMWVADMDFEAAPSVIASIQKALVDPVMGYFKFTDDYFNAIKYWQKTRHNRDDFTNEQVAYHNGVLGGVCSMISAFTDPGDEILVQSPGYLAFPKVIERLGRTVLVDPLIEDNGYFTYNFPQMEKTIKERGVKVAILCNPHNPSGRIWTKEELSEYVEICHRNNVTLIVDEIWCDVQIAKDQKYISAFLANEKAKEIGIGFYSASKGFNLAGLVASYSICYNPEIQAKMDDVSVPGHYNSPNLLATAAVIGAYSPEGAKWQDALLDYIDANMDYAIGYMKEHMPKLKVRKPDATYLMWLDFSGYGIPHEEIVRRTAHEAGVVMNSGLAFMDGGEGHMRMNMATPRTYVEQGVARLAKAFEDLK